MKKILFLMFALMIGVNAMGQKNQNELREIDLYDYTIKAEILYDTIYHNKINETDTFPCEEFIAIIDEYNINENIYYIILKRRIYETIQATSDCQWKAVYYDEKIYTTEPYCSVELTDIITKNGSGIKYKFKKINKSGFTKEEILLFEKNNLLNYPTNESSWFYY